ncbi:hypothetical protein [Parerythrobacter aestuarii]|uniref:hypothetical protein n=1 Tax=Parerythrobacter aestuarii TaxID=3020909 RepID=UPI0024DE48D1|nr:hypothetical protein [Parerythrobacter aestuarii]
MPLNRSKSVRPILLPLGLMILSACATTGATDANGAETEEFTAPIVLSADTHEPRFAVGEALAPDAEICLVQGEALTLLDADGEHVLAGPGCKTPVAGNFREDEPPEPETIEVEDRAIRVAGGSNSALARYPAGSLVDEKDICLEEGEQLSVEGPDISVSLSGAGCFGPAEVAARLERAKMRRARTQQTRQASAGRNFSLLGLQPRPEDMFVYRGSKSALARYPRGTRKAQYRQICLRGSERLTLVSKSGRKLTLGKGCDKPLAPDEGGNSGATTIGRLDRRSGGGDWATGAGE